MPRRSRRSPRISASSASIRARVRVEIAWLVALSDEPRIAEVAPFGAAARAALDAACDVVLAGRRRAGQGDRAHDQPRRQGGRVLAEGALRRTMPEIARVGEFIHFACTSEDINNLAHGLMLAEARRTILRRQGGRVLAEGALRRRARDRARRASSSISPARPRTSTISRTALTLAAGAARRSCCRRCATSRRRCARSRTRTPTCRCSSRTHGQPATPTTLGKEMANVYARLERQIAAIERVPLKGKANGAVGNYNAHVVAYPGRRLGAARRAGSSRGSASSSIRTRRRSSRTTTWPSSSTRSPAPTPS